MAWTAAVIVAVVQFGPWRKASADTPAAQVETQAPAQPPASQPPAVQPVAETPVTQAPVQTAAPVETQPAARVPSSRPRSAQSAPATERTSRPPAQPEAPPAPVQQQAAPPAQPPQNAAAEAAKRAELQRIREELVQVSARASAARTSVTNMQRSQAASGLGMRGDIVEASSLMQNYLQGANAALNAGDAEAAKNLSEKAERQLDRLEKFLGR